jgi:hypothetical protein
MSLTFTKKGNYVVALIKAMRTVAAIPVDGKIDVPGYEPAIYLGPSAIEDGIQMHGFRLPDGTDLALESHRLTNAIEVAQMLAAQHRKVDA